MTTLYDHDLALGEEARDPAMRHLLGDLDRLYPAAHLSPPRRASVDRVVYARLATTTTVGARIAPCRGQGMRRRLMSLAAALVLAFGGLTGYLRLHAPTPVSAQTILHRAAEATARLGGPSDEVIHQVSTVSTMLKLNVTPLHATVDQWIQLDAAGALVQRAATVHSAAGALVARILDAGGTEQIYDTAGNTIFTNPLPTGATPWTRDPSGLAYARQVLLAAQQNHGPTVRLLPAQTLNGVAVDVVAVDIAQPASPLPLAGFTPQHLTATFYIDAQTYALRGMDLSELTAAAPAPIVTMRVTGRDALPLASVPAATFALDAPADAQVWRPAPATETRAHQPFTALSDAIAIPDQPALLLARDIAGLRFHGSESVTQGLGTTITSYSYGPALRVADEGDGPVAADGIGSVSPTARSFDIQITHVAALDSTGTAPGAFTTRGAQPITVTIAGQPVQAQYWALETNVPPLHQVSYRQGASWVMISSQGLSKDEFFAAINALVDAKAHPDIVAQAQYESDVWDAEVQATGAATAGLCGACGS